MKPVKELLQIFFLWNGDEVIERFSHALELQNVHCPVEHAESNYKSYDINACYVQETWNMPSFERSAESYAEISTSILFVSSPVKTKKEDL